MNEFDFYKEKREDKEVILKSVLGNRGKCEFLTSGMCGEMFLFDQGETARPRYTCVKVPKPSRHNTPEQTARRFIRELKLQLSYYHNIFVNWAFDFHSVYGVPIASFRYWESDLAKLLKENQPSQITKLSLLVYTCVGLRHCYRKGLNAHQDLKPANIFIRDIKNDFQELPDLDIYYFALIADFGLANASIDYDLFDGSRPYMAPEQWKKDSLSPATDIFALGVIFFELMTNGYHPVGIKLGDFWPKPRNGNSKKWTREDPWKKWIKKGCQIETLPNKINDNVKHFIERMLSIKPTDRPSIDEVTSVVSSLKWRVRRS